VLVRDNSYSQPLPAAEGAKVGDAAKAISNSLRDAGKQIKHEEDCNVAYRLKKYPEAIAAARKGVQAYPQATIARTCLLNVYREMPLDSTAKRDSTVKLANEVLAIDPRNVQALTTVAQAYEAQGNEQKAVEAYTALVAADPTNVRIVEAATRAIARSGNPGVALPIIRQAAANSPGDPQLLRLQFLIELAAKDFKARPAHRRAARAARHRVRRHVVLRPHRRRLRGRQPAAEGRRDAREGTPEVPQQRHAARLLRPDAP
jgi:tetratricopeptide (TPR) repeat protein